MWSTYIGVDDPDVVAARVRDAGGAVLGEPAGVGDAGRTAVCADTSGAVFSLCQPGTRRGAQVVNASTWNWSNLDTPDMAAAQAFYGPVFGWEADVVELGDAPYGMWRLPGYGDFLERRARLSR